MLPSRVPTGWHRSPRCSPATVCRRPRVRGQRRGLRQHHGGRCRRCHCVGQRGVGAGGVRIHALGDTWTHRPGSPPRTAGSATTSVTPSRSWATRRGWRWLAGGAYVFTRSGSTWTQQTELTAADGGEGAGRAVAMTPTRSSLGAPYATSGQGLRRRGLCLHALRHELDAAATHQHRRSGSATPSVAPSRSQATRSSPGTSGMPHTSSRARVHAWTQQAKLTATDSLHFSQLGAVGVLGGHGRNGAGPDDRRARPRERIVFVRSGTAWAEQARLSASDGKAEDEFGRWSVAISGDHVIRSVPGAI